MRIFLIGFMGCGKSRVGVEVAHLLDFEFIDLDQAIEQEAEMSVTEIFARRGEAHFRSLESKVLKETAGIDNVVVATGGGAPLLSENLELMQRHGITVWLNTPLAVSSARVRSAEGNSRPLLGSSESDLELYNRRVPVYKRAKWRIDLDGHEAPSEVAREIFERVSSLE